MSCGNKSSGQETGESGLAGGPPGVSCLGPLGVNQAAVNVTCRVPCDHVSFLQVDLPQQKHCAPGQVNILPQRNPREAVPVVSQQAEGCHPPALSAGAGIIDFLGNPANPVNTQQCGSSRFHCISLTDKDV